MTFAEIINQYNKGIKEITDLLFNSNKEILDLDLVLLAPFIKPGNKKNGDSIFIFQINIAELEERYRSSFINKYEILEKILKEEKDKLSYIKKNYSIDVIKICPDFNEDIILFTEGEEFLVYC